MPVRDFRCNLGHLLVSPPRERIARRPGRRGWILFEGVLVDGLDSRRELVICCRKVRCGDSRCSGGNSAGHLFFDVDELGSTLPDLARESCCLGLSIRALCRRGADSGIGDGEIFNDLEAPVAGVLNGVDDPPMSCTNTSGPVSGDRTRLTKLVDFAADD
ncbi:hypothetical protein [Mycobacterium gordonae]|nr:hypothetical protein [Mycobacterium gordonae]